MGLFDQPYDPRGQERSSDFGEPIPRGKYRLEITAAEEVPTKAGDGAMLKIETTVRSQGFSGRKIFNRFNLRNPSQKAEEIARKEFNSLLDAIGMGDVIIKSPNQILGKVFTGRVDIESGNNGRQDNVIKGYEPAGVNTAPAAAAAAPAPAWQRSPGQPQQQAQAPQQQPAAAAPAPTPAAAAPAPPAAAPAAAAAPLKPWERRAAA